MDTQILQKILRERRTASGLSQQSLADRAGVSRNFVAQIERGESIPTVATLSRLAQALGTGVGELLGEELPATPAADTVPVPLVADRIAAGPPLYVADHIERYEHFPYSFLRNLGTNPRQAILVRLGADQDSMADTIAPGSTVLLDRTPLRDVFARGIYAVREEAAGEMGCAVKRLVLDATSRVLILLSDNPAHLPRAVRLKAGQPLNDVVIGRVVWWIPPAG
ncbi:MAG: XRE family transcriptional regulator [Acidobacteriota bacterium]